MATWQAQGSAAVPGQTDPIHLLPRHLPGFSSRACEQASSLAPEEKGASQAHRSQLGQSEGKAWTAAARGTIPINLIKRDCEFLHEQMCPC